MLQVGHLVQRNATVIPDTIALVFQEERITWGELNARADALAAALVASGIHRGDVVAYYMQNCVEGILLWWATQKIGVIAQPVNTNLLPEEVATCLRISGARAFFCRSSDRLREKVGQVLPMLDGIEVVVECGERRSGILAFSDFLLRGKEVVLPDVDVGADDGSLLIFTSGTTGTPKGVLRSQQVVRDYAQMMAIENENATKAEVLLTSCPMFHTAGMSLLMKMAVLGGTLVLFDHFDASAVLDAIDEHGVTQILLIPPHLYLRLKEARCGRHDLSSVVEAAFSGGAASQDIIEAMRCLFPNASFRFSWGSTETCAPTSAVIPYEKLTGTEGLHRTIGRLNKLVEMRLVGENGEDVPDNAVGEALVRSTMVFEGYLNDAETSREVLDDSGWFRTSDLLKRDAEGFYYLVDRKNDMIKTGGENVYSQEVEAVVMDFPGVLECAVIGVPDDRFGEAVAAVISVAEGEKIDETALVEWCRERLSGWKKPRYIAYVDKLPRNSVGKLQKSELTGNPELKFASLFG